MLCFAVGVALLAVLALITVRRKFRAAPACIKKQSPPGATSPWGGHCAPKPRGPSATVSTQSSKAALPTPPPATRSMRSTTAGPSEITCSHDPAAVCTPIVAGALQSDRHTSSHSRRKLHVGPTAAERGADGKLDNIQNPTPHSHSGRAAKAAATTAGSQRWQGLLPLRLPSQRDTSASQLSVNSGCGTPGHGTSGCYTPYSHLATPPSAHMAAAASPMHAAVHRSARALEASPSPDSPLHDLSLIHISEPTRPY